MAISDNLFFAILAMDAYNRGYGAGIDFGTNSDAAGSQIGNATVYRNKGDAAAQSAGFYAIAYKLADGSTVISYRGTDNPTLALGEASDVYNGWSIGAGFIGASQAGLALDFYQAVSGSSVFDTPLPSNVILTGHSLGGGLAGFVSALSGARGLGFDYMPIGIATWLEAAHEAYRRTGTVPLSPADILAAGVGLPSSTAFGAINIAYSALPIGQGERPFGDTAIWSMFDDADELGRAGYVAANDNARRIDERAA